MKKNIKIMISNRQCLNFLVFSCWLLVHSEIYFVPKFCCCYLREDTKLKNRICQSDYHTVIYYIFNSLFFIIIYYLTIS